MARWDFSFLPWASSCAVVEDYCGTAGAGGSGTHFAATITCVPSLAEASASCSPLPTTNLPHTYLLAYLPLTYSPPLHSSSLGIFILPAPICLCYSCCLFILLPHALHFSIYPYYIPMYDYYATHTLSCLSVVCWLYTAISTYLWRTGRWRL